MRGRGFCLCAHYRLPNRTLFALLVKHPDDVRSTPLCEVGGLFCGTAPSLLFGDAAAVGLTDFGDVDDIVIAPDKAISYAIINAGGFCR